MANDRTPPTPLVCAGQLVVALQLAEAAQRVMMPLSSPENRVWPSVPNASAVTFEPGVVKVRITEKPLVCQKVIVRSRQPATRTVPSGEKATAVTLEPKVLGVPETLPQPLVLSTTTVLSSLPVATLVPSGDQATLCSGPVFLTQALVFRAVGDLPNASI